jgi:molybdopterin molybdotransferase
MNQALATSLDHDSHGGCGAEKGLINVEQALQLVIGHAETLESEMLLLGQALNRYIAEDIFSAVNLPIFTQSAVDGYAICTKDEIKAQSSFSLVGEIRAGQSAEFELTEGQAVRIFTGAKTPAGATTVARQEIVQLQDQHIVVNENLSLHADIRDIGEEVAEGQLLASAGQKLNVGSIASLSMAGVKQLKAFRYPKIAVVITGDEVADTVDDLNSGKIFDANAPMIHAWFQAQNQTVDIIHVEDTEQAVTALFECLRERYDAIITTGGVSVGDYDFVRPVALKLGFKQIFWKVKQKPGKPMLFAKYQRENQRYCSLLGLPGNPAAVYIGLQVYVSSLLKALQGDKKPLHWVSGVIQYDVKPDMRERFLRMHAVFDGGIVQLSSLAKQQSHMLSNLMHANCIVRVPAGQHITAGLVLQTLFIES